MKGIKNENDMNSTVKNQHTAAWRFQVWASFILSFGFTTIGVILLPVEFWVKGYMVMGIVFLVGSCFGLAKTIRDDHESDKLINRITSAKTEKILKEFE